MSAEKKPLLLMVTKSGKTGVESLEEDKLKEMISDIGYTCKGVGEEVRYWWVWEGVGLISLLDFC